MVKVWWKKTCTTSKKGIAFLETKGVQFELFDIVTSPPPRELLTRHVTGPVLKRFINTSSKPYRELGLKNGLPPREQLIDLVLDHPDLIKRPVIEQHGVVSFGFNPGAIEAVLKA